MQELHGPGGTRPLLESAHKVSCALGPRVKQGLFKNLGQTYLQVLEGILGRQRSALGHCGASNTGGAGLRILGMSTPGGCHFGTQTWSHPSADKLPKVFLSPQQPLNLHLTSPAHQRDKTQLYPPVGRHQFLPPGSLHKPLGPTRGQTPEQGGL